MVKAAPVPVAGVVGLAAKDSCLIERGINTVIGSTGGGEEKDEHDEEEARGEEGAHHRKLGVDFCTERRGIFCDDEGEKEITCLAIR